MMGHPMDFFVRLEYSILTILLLSLYRRGRQSLHDTNTHTPFVPPKNRTEGYHKQLR